MALSRFLENLYSFRAVNAIVDTGRPDTAQLAAIEAKLVQANNDFLAGQYQRAIEAYLEAAGLIYAHLDPGYTPGPVRDKTAFPLAAGLFDPLLSVGVEWANVFQVKQPFSTTRPRVPVDNSLLMRGAVQTGVASEKLSRARQMNALADWQLAKTYASQNNRAQSDFFFQRAQRTDDVTVRELGDVNGQDAPPRPAVGGGNTAAVPALALDLTVGPTSIHAITETAPSQLPRPPPPASLTTGGRSLGMVTDQEVSVSFGCLLGGG